MEVSFTKLKPANGRFFIALLAGGTDSTGREVSERLRKLTNIEVHHHLSVEKDKGKPWQRSIPHEVDLVVILRDAISHSSQDALRREARRVKINVVLTGRKWGTMRNALSKHGVLMKMGAWSSEVVPSDPAPPACAPPPILQLVPPQPEPIQAVPEPQQLPEDLPLIITPPTSKTYRLLVLAQASMAEEGIKLVMFSPNEITIQKE